MATKLPDITLGFIPLIDAAVLIVAHEQGFFAEQHLRVKLQREVSWANIRDKLCIGALDGAHMLAPMPLAVTLGLSGIQTPLQTAFSLSLNGNAVTISNILREQLLAIDATALDSPALSLQALRTLIRERAQKGYAPLSFAMVYPFSCHNYLLRYWLASGGIDPDSDVNLVVIPPPQMVSQLAAGRIDGMCVGEPWNQVAATRGHGHIMMTGFDIWPNAPEKVFAVRSDWAEQHQTVHVALLRALMQASNWLGQQTESHELCSLLGQPEYLNLPPEEIGRGLHTGRHVFQQQAANFPWRSHALWLLTQMYRWGQITQPLALRAIAEQVYRPDIYRQALQASPLQPGDDYKIEKLADNKLFDPEQLVAYLYGFKIDHIGIARSQFKHSNV